MHKRCYHLRTYRSLIFQNIEKNHLSRAGVQDRGGSKRLPTSSCPVTSTKVETSLQNFLDFIPFLNFNPFVIIA